MSRFWSMGKGERTKIFLKKNPSPGPCAYSPKFKNQMPSWSMHGGHSKSISNLHESPGPGAYNLTQKVQ